MGKIILASSSPRRADILKTTKLDFTIIPSTYAEPHERTVFSYDYAESLAYNKALAVARNFEGKDYTIIGADTIVVIDNRILGKPQNRPEAHEMLTSLSGRTHFVVTGIALINSLNMAYKIKSTTTYVTFNDLTEEQINYYIDNFKPYDKAGSYGIQELPEGYVRQVQGSLDNVIGLPSKTLLEMLEDF